jgi:hypothetical protein
MEIHELVIEMKLLERRMTLYEEKYDARRSSCGRPTILREIQGLRTA